MVVQITETTQSIPIWVWKEKEGGGGGEKEEEEEEEEEEEKKKKERVKNESLSLTSQRRGSESSLLVCCRGVALFVFMERKERSINKDGYLKQFLGISEHSFMEVETSFFFWGEGRCLFGTRLEHWLIHFLALWKADSVWFLSASKSTVCKASFKILWDASMRFLDIDNLGLDEFSDCERRLFISLLERFNKIKASFVCATMLEDS